MNVYDFDKTIYNGDSTLDFYFYCLHRNPKIIKLFINQLSAAAKYKFGKTDKESFKEAFFCFLPVLKDIDTSIIDFWDINESKIKSWYKEYHRHDDVIISASPEFLLKEICIRLDIKYLIASKVDKYTGKFLSKNCHDSEKVTRFYESFPDGKIENFYSDSRSDLPLAEISGNSFLVKKNNISQWF
ncbi:MAG: haloacid dehalogenase-like hydrolase [Firmicutes bacterium]|nr:haloacid dehalogenase-like hydrolase [Bacillota bacterium]